LDIKEKKGNKILKKGGATWFEGQDQSAKGKKERTLKEGKGPRWNGWAIALQRKLGK